MNKQIYMIIDAHPDGDRYEIHNELKLAHTAFKEKMQEKGDVIFGEGTLYLIEVNDTGSFGFGSQGEVYGASIIEKFELKESD